MSELREQLLDVVFRYYPFGLEHSDPQFEASEQWARQAMLRQDESLHEAARASIRRMLGKFYPSERMEDESSPSMYPSYEFRLLLRPPISWPSTVELDWDLKFARDHGNVVWIHTFFCYLGPFFTGAINEFRAERSEVWHRLLPIEPSMPVCWPLLEAARNAGWKFVDFELLNTVVPGVETDTGGRGKNSFFALLFNDTYAPTGIWDASWRHVVGLEHNLESCGKDGSIAPDEVPIGQLIPEATVRDQLGGLPLDFLLEVGADEYKDNDKE
jgi:hypothetical protein